MEARLLRLVADYVMLGSGWEVSWTGCLRLVLARHHRAWRVQLLSHLVNARVVHQGTMITLLAAVPAVVDETRLGYLDELRLVIDRDWHNVLS